MPITYSTNLEIEHLDVGSQNKDLIIDEAIDALDGAIAGLLSLAVAGNTTLTDEQALRYAVIELSGAPGGSFNLIVPDNTKTYIVNNGTAFLCTVKTTLGTGVAIPAGEERLVRCDGTNVVAAGGGATSYSNFLIQGADSNLPNGVDITGLTDELVFQSVSGGGAPARVLTVYDNGNGTSLLGTADSGGSMLNYFDPNGRLAMGSHEIINVADGSSSDSAMTVGQAEADFAPIGSAFLVNGSDATLTAEVNVQSISSTLKFVASGAAVLPFAVKAAGSPSVDIFQIQDSGNTAQLAVNSSFQLDMKSHRIVSVTDPSSAQDASTKNYTDTNFGPTLLSFGSDSATTSVGTSYYVPAWYISTAPSTTERWIPIPKAGRLSNLRVIAGVAPAGGSVTFTVRKRTAGGGAGAGTDTTLIATLALGGTLATDGLNSVTVAAGDEISLKMVENAGYSGSLARFQATIMYTMG